MITLNKLNKFYNKGQSNEIHVIDEIDLKLPDSGMVAFFGPSGCGKTTLLNVIGGLDKYDSGEISVFGDPMKKNSDEIRNQKIGYIFQNYNLSKNETCFDNIAAALHLAGVHDEDVIRTRVMAALKNVGMEHFAKRTPDTLSGGQQQRIAIARAIVKNPPIILADEPTGNLDETNTVHIMNLLKEISKTHLVLLVTHEANLVDFYCDQVIELKDGKIVRTYENQHAEGYVAKGKNDIYLGDYSKKIISGQESYIEYYGEKPNRPFAIRLILKDNKFYVQVAKGQDVQILDASSEVQIHEGTFTEADKKKEHESQVDMSKLPPIHGSEFGKLFTFKSAVKSGYASIRNEKRRGSKLLRIVMSLFAAVVVFFTASAGTSIRTLSNISSSYNHNIFYMYFDSPTQYEKLKNGAQNAGIDGFYFKTSYDTEPLTISFAPGSFESFTPGYSFFGESYTKIEATAVPLNESLNNSVIEEGRKTALQDDEVVITTAVADKLLKNSSFSYIDKYTDLLGLTTDSFGTKKKLVGIVKSDEIAIYLTESALINYSCSGRYDLAVSNASNYNYSVPEGSVVFVNVTTDNSISVPSVGSTVKISGKNYTVEGVLQGYASYEAYLYGILQPKKQMKDYLFDKISADHPGITEDSSNYKALYSDYLDEYYCEWLFYYASELQGYAANRFMIASSTGYFDSTLYYIAANYPSAITLGRASDDDSFAEEYYYARSIYELTGELPTYTDVRNTMYGVSSYTFTDFYTAYWEVYDGHSSEVYSKSSIYSDNFLMNSTDFIDAISSFAESDPGILQEGYAIYYAVIHSNDVEKTEAFLTTISSDIQPQYEWLDVLVTPNAQRQAFLAESLSGLIAQLISLIVFAAIMSLCMFFIMRSSLMVRVKTIGIYRAIGVSKKNLSFRFTIESLVMTTCTTLIGFIGSSIIVKIFLNSSILFAETFYYPVWLALIVLLVIYGISALFGTLPVRFMMKKTPSEILSKYDI